ncbi:MAG: aminotransferase class I/II-fold pyridoxal phosphate-dependent enzyme [Bacteroidaceae bacterium]|nr:aminotransferase class I/II-fold pyridoxal phosphate-dependent enzyme [Bacteroidaceae bacterium]
MQAIILAAGMGKRLGELTKNNTKCMVSVNGVRLIDRMLIQLSALSLTRVVVVVGYEGEKLINYIGNRYNDKLNIEYVFNPIYDKTNNIYSLALAKQQMMEDDTLLLESDLIFDSSMLDLIINHPHPNLALVAKYETWMDGTMVRISEENDILNFIPKKSFRYSDKDLYYKTCNIYKFSKEFSCNQYVPFLEAYSKAMGDNEYYEQVLRVLTALDRSDLKALPITTEKWYEIDDVQDLDIAETMFSSEEDLLGKYHRRFGGYWRFPQLKDYCYLVNPYYPTSRMKDELRANFDVLLTEYPSGMYVNSLLAGKYFGISQDYVVVGNGAAELIKSYVENHLEGNIGIIYPTFEEYPNRALANRIVRYVPENSDFAYTAQNIKDYYEDKTISTLLLINPDNPSGNFIPMAELQTLIEWAGKRNITMIVDESFVDFTEDFLDNSLLHNSVLKSFDNLVVVKSISKSYGVPGLRLGILASANKELIAQMKKEVAIWNINSFAEFYMQIFGKYEKDYTSACYKFIVERKVFFEELKTIPFLRVIPSQANYFLCEVTSMYTATELTEILLRRYNILIKDCGTKTAFAGKQYIRIAIRDRKDNAYFVDALKELA